MLTSTMAKAIAFTALLTFLKVLGDGVIVAFSTCSLGIRAFFEIFHALAVVEQTRRKYGKFEPNMNDLARELLAVVALPSIDTATKLDLLTKLKASIKHKNIPEEAVVPVFTVFNRSARVAALQDVSFSILSHLLRRLTLQEMPAPELRQHFESMHAYFDSCLDSPNERLKSRVIHALVEWSFVNGVDLDIESDLKLGLLDGSSRRKLAVMQCITQLHKNSVPFFSASNYVYLLASNLKSTDSSVSRAAKQVIVTLLKDARHEEKEIWTKEAVQNDIGSSIRNEIDVEIGFRPSSSGSESSSCSKSSKIPTSQVQSSTRRHSPNNTQTTQKSLTISRNRSLSNPQATQKSQATSRHRSPSNPQTNQTKSQAIARARSTTRSSLPKPRNTSSTSVGQSPSKKENSRPGTSGAASTAKMDKADNTKKHKKAPSAAPALNMTEAVAPPVNPALKAELDPSKPITIDSHGTFFLSRHLTADNKDITLKFDDLSGLMGPDFEGREDEHNWIRREKNLIIMRKITKGNGPSEFAGTYIATIRTNLDGILRSINSLRTTISSHGCYLIQEAIRASGPGLDPAVEIMMETLIKLCGHTKNINAQNGNTTINTIFSNVTYKTPLLQHVMNAASDKNIRPRLFAQGWLKTIITRHINHKHSLEHGNGLELMTKIVNRGLADADVSVRESARDSFWSFNLLWPARGETIMAKLKPAAQTQLLQHPSNPDPDAVRTQNTESAKPKTLSRTAATASRSSLKEVMAAKKKEKAKLENQAVQIKEPVQPKAKAESHAMQAKEPIQQKVSVSSGSLSSAPLRPMRSKAALKKVEGPKHAIAAQRPRTPAAAPVVTRPTSSTAPTPTPHKVAAAPEIKLEPTMEHSHVELEQPLAKTTTDSVTVITEKDHKPTEPRQHLSELSDSRTNNGNNASDSNALALIDSGIKRINTNSLDAHGYRKLQSTISSNINHIGETRTRELVSVIIPRLGGSTSPSDDRIVLQQNLILRSLFEGKRIFFEQYIPSVVRNMIIAIGRYSDQSHVATTLEASLNKFNQDSEMPCMECLDSLASLSRDKEVDWPGRSQCFTYMESIIVEHQIVFEDANILLADVLREAFEALTSPNSTVRRQSTSLAAAAHKYAEDKKKYWMIFNSFSKADKTMLLYTIEHQGKH